MAHVYIFILHVRICSFIHAKQISFYIYIYEILPHAVRVWDSLEVPIHTLYKL